MKRTLIALSSVRYCGLVALASFLATSLNAQANFSGFYSEDEEGLAAFESGVVFATADSSGFFLDASSEAGSDSSAYSVSSLARFDDAGALLWSAYLDAGSGSRDAELFADFQDSSKFFAGFVETLESGFAARVGRFNGGDLSAVFAKQIPLQADASEDVELSYVSEMRSAVLQDLGSSVRLLVLDGSGNPVFEKSYSSSGFLASADGLFSTQNAKVSPIADGSGFYVSVVTSELNLSTTSYDNVFFLLKIDNAGALQWSKSFTLSGGAAATDLSFSVPGNGYLYTINSVDPETSVAAAHVVKFSSDGSLDFAKTIEGVSLLGQIHELSETALNFSGTITNPGDTPTTDAALLNLDPDTGAIAAQVGIDQGMNDFSTITGDTGGKLFGSVLSSDDPDFEDPVTTLYRFDSDLTNPIAFAYSGIDEAGFIGVKGSNELVFSPFNETAGSIGAFTLDADLVPALTPECIEFTSTALSTFDPGLSAADLDLSPADPTVEVADETTAMSDSTLPLASLALAVEPCAAEAELVISSHPADQTVEAGAEVTFSLTASGAAPVTYQWKKDGVEIAGATSATLELSDVQSGDAGVYTVVVSDANGELESEGATLTVNETEALAITSHPSSQTVFAGESVTLSVTATGPGELAYQWKKDEVELPGETGSSLTLEDVSESDAGVYVVVVSNADDSVTSDPATVTVEAAPNEGFAAYLDGLQVPSDQRGFGDDPDMDKTPSGLEYLMGSDAGDASSRPEVVRSVVRVEGQVYLAVSFPRDTSISDLALSVQFSASIDFDSVLDAVEVSREPLEGDIERVTLRGSVPIGAEAQFARLFGGAAE